MRLKLNTETHDMAEFQFVAIVDAIVDEKNIYFYIVWRLCYHTAHNM